MARTGNVVWLTAAVFYCCIGTCCRCNGEAAAREQRWCWVLGPRFDHTPLPPPVVHSGRDLYELFGGHLQCVGIDTVLHVPRGNILERRRNVVHRVSSGSKQLRWLTDLL